MRTGVQSIPAPLRSEVDKDLTPYVVAHHYSLDPDTVRSWDNDSIMKALYALKKIGVIK
ncbi:hypothetical protein [Solibacillus sp. CAU 1738]|uniref:hypothetical protein n=1 Tax=Solibacillus sp. CAU 1738 TaxID=3140363 RepID=UPI003260DE78